MRASETRAGGRHAMREREVADEGERYELPVPAKNWPFFDIARIPEGFLAWAVALPKGVVHEA